jgi:hypothetical protein
LSGRLQPRAPDRPNAAIRRDDRRQAFFIVQTFLLLFGSNYISLSVVKKTEIIRRRDRLVSRLPSAQEILRGSLLERTIRHGQGCGKCERGEGHPVSVLAVGYAGHGMRQISLRKDQVAQVKRALENYRKLKAALEEICELNQQLLRAQPAEPRESRR